MKTSQAVGRILACLSIFVATTAFATNRGNLHLSSPAIVAGKQLLPGDYIVQWDDDAASVDLAILQKRKVVATPRALVRNLGNTCVNDTSVMTVHRDGSKTLWQIFFSGKRISLEFTQDK
jgi:hypothetical protein